MAKTGATNKLSPTSRGDGPPCKPKAIRVSTKDIPANLRFAPPIGGDNHAAYASASKFEVVAAKADTLELYIYDVIGETFWGDGVGAKTVRDALDAHPDVKSIVVYLNSPGGSVFDGIAIYNQLVRHKAHVTMQIDGMALSIASVLAMAGDEIVMASNAWMMIHDPLTCVCGNAADMRAAADQLDRFATTIAKTYAARTGETQDDIADLMRDETWMDADEAVANGFADRVVEAKAVAAFGESTWYERPPKAWSARLTGAAEADPPASSGHERPSDPTQETENNMADETKTPQSAGGGSSNSATPSAESGNTNGGTAASKAATLNELKAVLPKADSDFLIDCLGKEHTVAQAKDAWLEKVTADAETLEKENADLKAKGPQNAGDGTPGNDAVPGSGGKGGAPIDDPIDAWNDKVRELTDSGKLSKAQAIGQLARDEPELHAAYIDAYNDQQK